MYASTVYMYMRYTNAITLSSLSRGCSLLHPLLLTCHTSWSNNFKILWARVLRESFGGHLKAPLSTSALESLTQSVCLSPHLSLHLLISRPLYLSLCLALLSHSNFICSAEKAKSCRLALLSHSLSISPFPSLPFHSLLTFPTAMQIFRCNWECLRKVFFLTTLTLLWGKASRQFVIRTHMFICSDEYVENTIIYFKHF